MVGEKPYLKKHQRLQLAASPLRICTAPVPTEANKKIYKGNTKWLLLMAVGCRLACRCLSSNSEIKGFQKTFQIKVIERISYLLRIESTVG